MHVKCLKQIFKRIIQHYLFNNKVLHKWYALGATNFKFNEYKKPIFPQKIVIFFEPFGMNL
jgi:hypothetical protein